MARRRTSRTRKAGSPALLLYADSERNADQLYFSGFHVPDPFIAMRVGGRKIGVVGALEFGRTLKESDFDEVLSFEQWQETARKKLDCEQPRAAEVIVALARSRRLKRFTVSPDFSYKLALRLAELGLRLDVPEGALLPQREIKTDEQAKAIAAGNRCSALGLAAAEDALRRSTVRRGRLVLDGRPLTSERVREAIDIACLRAGAVASHTIVAGGDQACDPHCSGSGMLRAGELIIVDIFPRVTATGYNGDMTRTFLKGTPNDAQVKLVETVRAAQKAALAEIRANVHGSRVHQRVIDFFQDAGYETTHGVEGSSGFFHGTGHGLGLEVHEAPNMGRNATVLRHGAVVTVEPGLYYRGLGGCRIEDVVQVTRSKPRMLSRYHYEWIIA
ncbi:MAG: M24 family metallopeptidase [Opitutaceae bacterium]